MTKIKSWLITNIEDNTRKQIRRYAFDNDLTIAEAIEVLVAKALRNG